MVANGIECFECGATTGGGEAFDECPVCESDNTGGVLISPCPVGAGRSGSGRACPDEDHHWGRGDHVKSLDPE